MGAADFRRLACHRKARPRRHLQDQRGRSAALEGDGNRELPDRRLRTAPHELALLPRSRRLGAEDDEGVGLRERPSRDVEVRPRLAESTLRRARGDAARVSADGLPESLDARHQRTGDRRRRHRRHQHREGFRHLPRQAPRKVRPVDADARRGAADDGARPSLFRRRAHGTVEAAGQRTRARPRQLRRQRRVRPQADAVLDRRRRGGGLDPAAATAARSSCSRRRASHANRTDRRSRRR